MPQSVVVFVVFEHLFGIGLRKGNIIVQLTGRETVSTSKDILDLTQVLTEKGYIEPVILNWKEMGLQETVLPPATEEKA